MVHSRDERLDQWIEQKLLKKQKSKRYAVGAFTKYPNKALCLLSDLEFPFTLRRREDMKFEVSVFGVLEIADSWEDLALAICRLIFRVVEGATWPHLPESIHAEEHQ